MRATSAADRFREVIDTDPRVLSSCFTQTATMPEFASRLRDLFLLNPLEADVTKADSGSNGQKWHFTSRFPPPNSGNEVKASYGGSTLAMVLMAASKTVDLGTFSISSALGHFLGPASPTTRLCLVVHDVRTTLSFCTRHVQVYQNVAASRKDPAKQHRRQVMTAVVDYQRQDAPQLFEFSASPETFDPSLPLLPASDECCVNMTRLLQDQWPADVVRRYSGSFGRFNEFFESRVLPHSPQVTNAYGHIRETSNNPQAHLPLTERTNASWFKAREELADDAERVAATT